MGGKPDKSRRKRFLIDREVQVGITLRFVFIFILFVILSTAVVFIPSGLNLLTGSTVEELARPAEEFLLLHRRIWPMIAIVIGGTIVYSVIFTHRLAGPIFRLNKELRKMLDGDFPEKIALRKKDFFKETASLLEELSNKVRVLDPGPAPERDRELLGRLSLLKEELMGFEGKEGLIEIIESIEEMVEKKS